MTTDLIYCLICECMDVGEVETSICDECMEGAQ